MNLKKGDSNKENRTAFQVQILKKTISGQQKPPKTKIAIETNQNSFKKSDRRHKKGKRKISTKTSKLLFDFNIKMSKKSDCEIVDRKQAVFVSAVQVTSESMKRKQSDRRSAEGKREKEKSMNKTQGGLSEVPGLDLLWKKR